MEQAQKCRVLLVEDQAAVSMLMEDMLLDLGVEIVGPTSKLDAAMELARTAEMEAAVLDINVRGAFSYPVADVLRDRGVSVIFATGYNSSVLPERFRGTSVLLKPFDERQSLRLCKPPWPTAPASWSYPDRKRDVPRSGRRLLPAAAA
jgi:CheY-like chemotaxis protein